jgi:hypothetical protein
MPISPGASALGTEPGAPAIELRSMGVEKGAAKRTAAAPRRAARRSKTATRRAADGVLLENRATGETRRVKQGFAWTLFLFAGVLGVPLFARRLYGWGGAVLGLWAFDLGAVRFTAGAARVAIEALIFCVFLGLQLWLGLRGNALTTQAYLHRGWVRAR